MQHVDLNGFGFATSQPFALGPSEREVPLGHYRAELSTVELITEVRRLLAAERHAERLVCRYLADLADRVRARQDLQLFAFADEFQAARCFFGLGVRETRERARIGRALRQLPRVERAFIAGALSYSRVREVTRVATPETELLWLELAEVLDMRALERRVAAAGETSGDGASGPSDPKVQRQRDEPWRAEWTSPNTMRLTFQLTAEAWALLERAMSGARRSSGAVLTDSDALEAVARDALSIQTADADASDPRRSVVVYECKHCQTSELDTGSGALTLDSTAAAVLGCGATEIDLQNEGRKVKRGGPLPAAVRRAVMLRDRCTCRVPGCNRRRYVDVHHLTAQADGGEHSRRNCLVLCTTHHRLLHEGKLQIRGDAEHALDFRDATGALLVAGPIATEGPSGELASMPGGVGAATQGGSSEGSDEAAPGGIAVNRAAQRILRVMGGRGGWTTDALIQASGLPARDVSVALTLLELGRCIRRREYLFDPMTPS